MRIAVCDSDSFMREMVESLATTAGHDVVGVAIDTQSAVGLLEAARPDLAVIDIAMHVGSDFDLITIAGEVGARVVVFSQQADVDSLEQYAPRPEVVFKPDFGALERAFAQVAHATGDETTDHDRRQRPVRAAQGPVSTSVTDAQAFFEALNNAEGGDALVAFDVPAGAEGVALEVWRTLRDTDRVLFVPPRAVRCFLPGGGEDGIRSVLARVATVPSILEGCSATSVVVRDDELGADAFDRLKREGEPRVVE
jgi:CheY-like chemotaxis protein